MGQCASYVICPAFRKGGQNRYTEFVPNKNWRYTDEQLLSELQGNNSGENEEEMHGEEASGDNPESSGLLQQQTRESVESIDNIIEVQGDEEEVQVPEEDLNERIEVPV
ncbi:uncharacterized protein [Oscarella lobularis]|uniref:uncharacterized protein n=1 Tax=Oscarella lobularis TaxID=121494 RepID=UPI0033135B4F